MQGKLTLVALCTALLAVALAAPANAGVLVASASSCEAQQFSKPFARFADYADYTGMPGGSFEGGSSAWTLAGGAKVVSGNEPWNVGSATDSRSLFLPQGATATSPAMCVGIEHPTTRWFAKSPGSLTGAMTVEVLFEDSLGQVLALPIGAGTPGTSWLPSLPGVVGAGLLPLLPGSKTAVAFRFRAVSGSWYLDDAYVDPFARW